MPKVPQNLNDAFPRKIALLGATGSIGTQTVDVVKRLGPDKAQIIALAARKNVDLLAGQARETGASHVAVTDDGAEAALAAALGGSGTKTLAGNFSLETLASLPEVDTVVVAVAGAAGLRATLAACRLGKRVCIATKEVLVAAGELVMKTARENGAEVLPIDSEHSAIFQCVRGYKPADISRLFITASGGPFRTWSAEQIKNASVSDALNHPTWRMGGKITIDSATLMNKGLEVMEAAWLFGVGLDRVSVVVHPQSVIHSFVELSDGALLAQMGLPDMRLPIQIALMHPEKIDTDLGRLNPAQMGPLTFEAPDETRFPALGLARRAAQTGGTAPAVLNAANEAAVPAFLDGKIGFTDICALVEQALSAIPLCAADTLENILDADRKARQFVRQKITPNDAPIKGNR